MCLATAGDYGFNYFVTDNDGKNGKAKRLYDRCNSCGRLIKWLKDMKTGKYIPSVPGQSIRHKCRSNDYLKKPTEREGYL